MLCVGNDRYFLTSLLLGEVELEAGTCHVGPSYPCFVNCWAVSIEGVLDKEDKLSCPICYS